MTDTGHYVCLIVSQLVCVFALLGMYLYCRYANLTIFFKVCLYVFSYNETNPKKFVQIGERRTVRISEMNVLIRNDSEKSIFKKRTKVKAELTVRVLSQNLLLAALASVLNCVSQHK